MPTMLEGCTTEEQRSIVRFLWTVGLNAKDIHKEMFPVGGGKCLSRKAVHNWVEKFSQGRFDALIKKWDKCIEVGGGFSFWFPLHGQCFPELSLPAIVLPV
jgi:hypothetical protein